MCDREREIDKFTPEEYWNMIARLAGPTPPEFDAKLQKQDGANIKVTNKDQADAILKDLKKTTWTVGTVVTKERKKGAVPPFITSKLQQAARFPVKKTMMIAQQLYEGIELPGEGAVGLITYMRTDSTRVSEEALTDVRKLIGRKFGPAYVPEKPNAYKTKSDAQDAHEAIRPTSMQYDPEAVRSLLTPDQYYLYKLIWNRFVASQMPPAAFDETTVDIIAGRYLFRVKGSVPKFAGWLAVYNQETVEERIAGPGPDAASSEDDDGSSVLPPLKEGDTLELRELRPEQKFTQPPARYSEATLVKALEENGIGRPSTYASIIGVIQARDYVNKIEGRFKPTVLGRMLVDRLLSPAFDDILDVEYTRNLEEDLDKIEEGTSTFTKTLTSFYKKFEKDLKRASKEMINLKEGVEPDPAVACDKCGKPMVIKAGKFGLFLACSGYPDCENTRELETPEPGADGEGIEEACENCGKPMAMKRGRFGQFLACTGYPECKTTAPVDAEGKMLERKTVDVPCPTCGKGMMLRRSRFGVFLGCADYPNCKGLLPCDEQGTPLKVVKEEEVKLACPECGAPMGVRRKGRRPFMGCSRYPECKATAALPEGIRLASPPKAPVEPVGIKCPKCKRDLVYREGKRGKFIACSGFPRCRNAFDISKLEELKAQATGQGAAPVGASPAPVTDPASAGKKKPRKPARR